MSDQKNPDPITARVLDLIGPDALAKLHRHGFAVAELAAVQRFREEYREDKDRIRETAAAAMRAIGIDSVRVELVSNSNGVLTSLICTAPCFDELQFAKAVGDVVKDHIFPPAGAVQSETPPYNTNNVPFCTTPPVPPPSPDNAPDRID